MLIFKTKKLLRIFSTNMCIKWNSSDSEVKFCFLVPVGLLVIINFMIGYFYLRKKISSCFQSDAINNTVFWNTNMENNRQSNYSNNNQNLAAQKLKTNVVKTKLYTKDSVTYIYQYIIENANFCSRGGVVKKMLPLIILVFSVVNNIKNRQAIRNTWGSVAYDNNKTGSVKLAFLLGFTTNTALQKLVMEESLQHTDIIQGNFYDTYPNLTLKSIMLLKWITKHCENVSFVLKTDDDMYINVDKLLHTLTQLSVKSNVMYGDLFERPIPERNKNAKWYVSKEQFRKEIYPNYLSGTAYVMSRDIIPKLYEVCTKLPFFVMEDIFITGLCANKAGVQRYPMNGFTYLKREPTGCAFEEAISGHHVTIKDMNKIWTELQKPKPICREYARNTKR